MSGVISAVKRWAADYARAALLALLLHALLLACLLRLEFTQVPPPKPAAPVVSYLYQPPPIQTVAAQPESNAPEPEPAALPSALSAAPEPEVAALAGTDNPATQADAVSEKQPAAVVIPSGAAISAPFSAQPEQSRAAGLAQRALSSAATPSARAIEDAATASYQQFLQAQQQPFYELLTEKDGNLTQRGQQIISHTPMNRFGQPEDLLGALHWLCSDASAFVTGSVVAVDGGFSAYTGV